MRWEPADDHRTHPDVVVARARLESVRADRDTAARALDAAEVTLGAEREAWRALCARVRRERAGLPDDWRCPTCRTPHAVVTGDTPRTVTCIDGHVSY